MKEKSLQEKNAAERQVELITSALGDAADSKGYWLNAAGKSMPKFYPKGVSVSPFNALVMGLNARPGTAIRPTFTPSTTMRRTVARV